VVVVDGETVSEVPVPTTVPPQLPVDHTQTAPVPKEPPTRLSVVDVPLQTGLADALIEVGAVDRVFTVTVTLAHAVVLQVPSARTKYVVVAAGVTEMLEPVPTKVPPQLPEYHCQLAPVPNDPPVLDSVTDVPSQTTEEDVDAEVGAEDKVFTVIARLAHAVVLHVPSART
jgi:hypothetical protein